MGVFQALTDSSGGTTYGVVTHYDPFEYRPSNNDRCSGG